jgi:FkbM family methyltransferase
MIRIPRPVGTLTFLLAWLVPWRPAFRIRAKQSKLSFFVHWRDLIGRHIAKYGTHEPLLTQWMATYLATSTRGIFVDIGANLGWHSLHAAQHEAVDAVVAFEPDAFNAWLLDRNLSLNGIDKVIVNTCAVGAQCGSIRLHHYRSTNYGRHSILADYGLGSRMVPITDLDSALDALGLPDRRVLILKIDVEGYEPAVVAGAKRTLARTDVVIIEYSPDLSRSGGLSADEMLGRLHAAGFIPHRFATDGRIEEIAVDHLRQVEGQIDVIWIRADKVDRNYAATARAV